LRLFSRARGALRLLLALAIVALPAPAHLLDEEQAQEYLAVMSQAHGAWKSGKAQAERLEALYKLAAQAFSLANRMDQDFREHGLKNPKLMDSIIRRARQFGVSIRQTETGFAYDMAAFREYLRAAPAGSHAADCQIMLIEHTEVPDDLEQLGKAISEQSRFLSSYPAHPSAAAVRSRLAATHLRLAKLLRFDALLGDPSKRARAEKHERAALALYKEITLKHPNSPEAAEARNYLASHPQRSR